MQSVAGTKVSQLLTLVTAVKISVNSWFNLNSLHDVVESKINKIPVVVEVRTLPVSQMLNIYNIIGFGTIFS